MSEAQSQRHDTADIAERAGWVVNWTEDRDVYTKNGSSIEVTYLPGGHLHKATSRGPQGEVYTVDSGSGLNADLLRSWLTVRRRDVPTSAEGSGKVEDFWREFRLRLGLEHDKWDAVTGTRSSRWSDVKIATYGTHYATLCSRIPKRDVMRLELRFKKPKEPEFNAARYEALYAVKDQFEAALGEEPIWDKKPGRNDQLLYLKGVAKWVPDEQAWQPMFEWLMDAHVRFMRAIEAIGGLDRL